MSNIKSEFEKLPEISEILNMNGGGYYRELTKDYHHNYPYFEKFLNGAWSMYQYQQSKVDELTIQVAEMKSRLNDAYTDGQSVTYAARQSKIDELQKKNAWLSDVAERENKRANNLQEENVNTTTLLGKTIQEKNEIQKQRDSFIKAYEIEMNESIELQKRLDAALEVVKQGIRKQGIGKQCGDYYLEKVEQLLEGGE